MRKFMAVRVSFFIDGFNLYHSLKQFTPECRWLDLYKLCESFLKEDECIENIYYFTALSWNKYKADKHKLYIRALRTRGVIPVYGKFKNVQKHCNLCGQYYETHEEKRTDVNIAMGLFEDGMKDMYDKAVIISADSDLIPPIEKLQENFPVKKIGVIAPMGRRAKELKEVADFFSKIDKKRLESCCFPKVLELADGNILAPERWLNS